MEMNVTVVGPGALGCLFAAYLARAGHRVWMLDRDRARARLISGQGVVLYDQGQQLVLPVEATADANDIDKAEFILLCVKSHDTLAGIGRAAPLLHQGSILIALQNGIAHHQVLRSELTRWAVGITAQGATLCGPGQVKHGGEGLTSLGFIEPAGRELNRQLQKIEMVFNRAGLQTEVSRDILGRVWNKLIVNAGINALTALYNCPNGGLLEEPRALVKLELAVQEVARLAAAKGIKVHDDPVAMTKKVCQATADNISSMLQDIRQDRATEIEAINGAVVSEAHRAGLPVPVNEELLAAVMALQSC